MIPLLIQTCYCPRYAFQYGWSEIPAPAVVNQVSGEVLRIYAINILNSGGRLLNSGSRLLNSGGCLLNSGGRLLNSGGRLLKFGWSFIDFEWSFIEFKQ